MTLALPLALLAILLLGVTTHRQQMALFARPLARRTRHRLRALGWGLLGLSLIAALAGPDRARHLIAWIGTCGLFSLAIALGLSRVPAKTKKTWPSVNRKRTDRL
jgi:peptidoglycan/LPS O-acetylase OafA/YrhL